MFTEESFAVRIGVVRGLVHQDAIDHLLHEASVPAGATLLERIATGQDTG